MSALAWTADVVRCDDKSEKCVTQRAAAELLCNKTSNFRAAVERIASRNIITSVPSARVGVRDRRGGRGGVGRAMKPPTGRRNSVASKTPEAGAWHRPRLAAARLGQTGVP